MASNRRVIHSRASGGSKITASGPRIQTEQERVRSFREYVGVTSHLLAIAKA